MIEAERKILRLIRNATDGIQEKDMIMELHLDENVVHTVLKSLEDRFKIKRTRYQTYQLVKNEALKIGKVYSIENQFYVKVEDHFIPILENKTTKIKENSYVIARIRYQKHGFADCLIESYLKTDFGEVYQEDGRLWIKPSTSKGEFKFLINNPSLLVTSGSFVEYEIGREMDHQTYLVDVSKIVSHVNNSAFHYTKYLRQKGIANRFPYKVIQDAGNLPNRVYEYEFENRIDEREEMVFTIDGAGTRDFDDAVSLKKLENGNYNLKVHIADVAHYVKENSSIDQEAALRKSSCYFFERVSPMLPFSLSKGICSLNPDVDRLTLTCSMMIDPSGNIIDSSIYESVIHSKKRMIYHEVDQVLKGEFLESYEPFRENLFLMNELAQILHHRRMDNGAIEFNPTEFQYIYDTQNKVIGRKERIRGEGQMIITEFMIAANMTVPTKVYLPMITRVNPDPDLERFKKGCYFIRKGLVSGCIDFSLNEYLTPILDKIESSTHIEQVSPKDIQTLLHLLENETYYNLYSALFQQCLRRAQYKLRDENSYHFALALENYTHFTSPIRRYPDLLVHRVIKKQLSNEKVSEEEFELLKMQYSKIAKEISDREQYMRRLERGLDAQANAYYMSEHIGESFSGIIFNISRKCIQVIFDEGAIEGRISMIDFQNDACYNSSTNSVTCNGKDYYLGDRIEVIVKSVDLESSIIYLEEQREYVKKLEMINHGNQQS